MNSLGILSAYSAYTGKANSAYGSVSASETKDVQRIYGAQNSQNGIASVDINDEAIISDEAKNLLATEQSASQNEHAKPDETKPQESERKQGNKPDFTKELTAEQEKVVAELKARDLEVKAHEQAHMAAASGINASAPSYSYQTGPDGKRYAIGGEVSISFVASEDPAENIQKAQTMKAAALAPAQPSSQDLSVAQNADKMIAQYRKEISEEKAQELQSDQKASEQPDETKSEAPPKSKEFQGTDSVNGPEEDTNGKKLEQNQTFPIA